MKEFAGYLHNYEAREYWSEALGRQYWHYCSGDTCDVALDWTATTNFLMFLSYSESMAKLTLTDPALLFPDGQLYIALTEARRIRYGAVGSSGKEPNQPYHFF